jgi:hypothetical protein
MLLRLTPTLLLLRDILGFRNGFSFGFDDGLFQDWLAWLKEEGHRLFPLLWLCGLLLPAEGHCRLRNQSVDPLIDQASGLGDMAHGNFPLNEEPVVFTAQFQDLWRIFNV